MNSAFVKPPEKKIPEQLLACEVPKKYPPAEIATQADVEAALTDTYLAWETTCDNLKQVDGLVNKP